MAQYKPEYEKIEELTDIAIKLVSKYPEVLHGIEPESVVCYAITNKDRGESKPLYEVKTVPYPIRLDCPYDYYVIVYNSDWQGMGEKHKAILTFKALCNISKEGDGRVIPFDLKDHAVVVRTLGVDHMSDGMVPDILNGQVEWKI